MNLKNGICCNHIIAWSLARNTARKLKSKRFKSIFEYIVESKRKMCSFQCQFDLVESSNENNFALLISICYTYLNNDLKSNYE